MNLIDRRLNPSGKSLPNRQKFLRRARKVIRDAVHQVSGARSIREADEPGVVLISAGGIEEPSFRLGSQGIHDRVLAGNRQFNEGDRIPRPPGSGSGGGSQGAGEGESEDQYTVALSAEEFLHFFLEDLELPDLERRTLSSTESEGLHRAGYAFSGSPANLAIGRTMRNSLTRRIALKRPRPVEVATAQSSLEQALAEGAEETQIESLRSQLETLKRRARTISWIDPIDLRYRRFEPVPKPSAQAVMFCLMDVSASMNSEMKDLAKRFFMLLYVFLKKRYKKVDIVFIRHTDQASEVDEHTFFYGVESGGTKVSSAQLKMLEVMKDRYPLNAWNIYAAQASDGDNETRDNEISCALLDKQILPACQYYAYLEVGSPSQGYPASSLWRAYSDLNNPRLAQRAVTDRSGIYPIFRELFSRDQSARGDSR